MAINKLCAAFWQITINRQCNIITRYYSSHFLKDQKKSVTSYSSENATNLAYSNVNIKFAPRTLNIDFGNLDNITRRNIIEIPLKNVPSMEEPLIRHPIKHDLPLVDKTLDLPSIENVSEKQAVRLIVIRRQKMKKHKKKKFRRKMKFKLETIRNRRNVAKEKAFQAELLVQIKKATAFDAKKYVQERLDILSKERIPRTYRGEILSKEMIKKFLEEDAERRRKRCNKFRLTLD
ncbi:uncharacterized protein LOC116427080 [Nomia melanderi]|uniref:uncharacterized protein LOC116427080 n=1 Tax=Nomia melanderi TaxID=2448451 RepID=UPI00130453B8|nr:uncharacterized protein LOC116427080 [Nomia melanderi]